ncbi:unnamed protein product [Brassica oleracea]
MTLTELPDSLTVSPHSNLPRDFRHSYKTKDSEASAAAVSCAGVKGNGNGKSCDDSDRRNYVVYKPNSKLVSQATVFVFANMDRSSAQIQLKQTRTEESDCPRSYYKCTLPPHQMSG